MAIEKIKYKNKVAIKNDESLPEINKVTDENMNEIKKVINNNADELSLIKNQIPTGQATGNPIHIADSTNLEAKLRLNGGSKQETRSNNLYNPETNVAGYLNQAGEIISNNNWVITDYIPVLEALDYYIAGNKNLTDGDGVYGAYYNADKELISTFPYSTYKTETTTITTPENCAYIKFSIYKYQDNTKTFDFYTNAPTPNYQSKVETVGSNVNLFDKDLTPEQYYYDNNGNKVEDSASLRYFINQDINITKKQLTISFSNIVGSNTSVRICEYKKDDTFIKRTLINTNNYTINLNADTDYIIASVDSDTTKGYYFENLKIEEGNQATPYSPYNMGSVEIDVCNKNFLKFIETDKTQSGLDVVASNNSIEVNGTSTASINLFNVFEDIKLKKGTYTFSFKAQNPPPANSTQFILCKEDGSRITTLNAWGSTNSNAITLEEDTFISSSKSYFYANKNITFSNTKYELQIEKGESATEIIEPQSQTKIMPIQQELLEGDYIEDVEHHGWNKIVLTGNETYGFASESVQPFRLNLSDAEQLTSSQDIAPNAYCTHFTPVAWNSSKAEMDAWTTALVGKQLAFGYRKITTLEDWKAYLAEQYSAGTPVTVYYKLATPLDLELTEEQKEAKKINTYNNVTNIVADNSLATLDVTYKKDQNTVNKNYENRIAALEAAILS